MKFVQTCLVTGLVIGIPCAGFAQQSKGSLRTSSTATR
jgi:hypothetical protein